MHIWVDADACPREVRTILLRAAHRVQLPITFVGNHPLGIEENERVRSLLVPPRADEADRRIVELVGSGDVVITADIAFAADVVDKGAACIDPRGHEYTADDVRERLAMRNAMEEMRGAGMVHGGPSGYSDREKQRFAAALDRTLTRGIRRRGRS